MLFIGQPANDGSEERPEELGCDVGEHGEEVDGHTGTELRRPGCHQAEGHGWVEVRPGVVGDDDAGEDRKAPAESDHEEPAAETLVLGQCDVGDHTGSEEDQHPCAEHFR